MSAIMTRMKRLHVEVILVIFLTIFIVRYYFSMGIVAKHPATTTTTTTIMYSKSSPSINNATVKLLSPNLQEKEAATSARLQSLNHSSSSAPSSVNSTIETISQPDDEDVFSKPIIEPVWGSLVRILKRPETLQAAQEASKAGILGWKELMKEIESDKAALNRTSNHTSPQGWKKVGVESRQCPNSSTFSDFSSASSGLSSTQQQQGSSWRSSSSHHELPIPCGLVVDSSITIVATPGGQISGDSFEIALLGPSQLKGEADDAPIFLNYSVQFTGDNNNSTNPPVIVQSTWTSEKQWQHEERCPSSSYSSPAIDKHPEFLAPGSGIAAVDGLEICNADVGKVVTRPGKSLEKTNTVDKDQKCWFPFSTGLPFTATLRMGLEGFHMTVNGKHISSFAYHQGMEPWSVNRIWINGNIQPTWMAVNGLPNAKDSVMVPDLKPTKVPPMMSKNIELFIGVFSTSENFDRRMAIRTTWMQYPLIRNGTIVVRFFIGMHHNHHANKELWNEAVTYGDIQILPFVDNYDLIVFKTVAVCMYATKVMKTKYVMKTDDDTFVRIDGVQAAYRKRNTKHSLWLGLMEFSSVPHRDPSSKWYVRIEEWPEPQYPTWAHGPGYIISEDIAQFVVKGHEEKNLKKRLKYFKLEDVALGMWIEEYQRRTHIHVEFMDDKLFVNMGCEPNYVIAHYQSPPEMHCLWNLLLRGNFSCCHIDSEA
ncbi:hypothetical protein BDL97_17G004700 [Sphagnum fallax]|nr:hypothetical protein BDL97_17G004700 [Sphagnum fallax]KAH8934905.1 hypothetical protein BDL97_17G004700 [Sphagnum fallax]KAH8934906.1 hypothetical protein BDL97_17G004700 [Sphagnum fallax]